MNINRDNLFSLLNHYVNIKTRNKQSHRGKLVCIDPVTLAIVVYNDERQEMSLIMFHAIISIEKSENEQLSDSIVELDFQRLCDSFFEISSESSISKIDDETTEEMQEQRRRRVLQTLQSNNVPVEEMDDGQLIAAYSVCIAAPYGESDCQSNNALVLERIRDIIRRDATDAT